MADQIRVLLLEDVEEDALLVLRELRGGGFEVTPERVETREAFRRALEEGPWDLVLADYRLPSYSGLEALQDLRATGRDLPFILVSGTIDQETAVGAMRAGAHDYLMKSELGRLVPAVRRELKEAEIRRQHRAAQAALAENEARFRQLIDSVGNLAVQGYGPDGVVHFWNKASEDLYGYTSEEALGRDLVELIIPPPMREEVRATIREGVARGRMPPPGELELMHKDGSPVAVLSSHAILRFPGREPELYCLDVDLRDRKQAMEALRRSRETLAKVVSTSPAGIAISTFPEGRFVEVNEAILQMLGFAREEMVGKTSGELRIWQDPGFRDRMLQVLQQGGAPSLEETRVRHKDGGLVDVLISMGPLQMEGQPCVLSVAVDITGRKRTEEALQHSEQKYRGIFDESVTAIFIFDTEKRFVDANQAGLDLLGRSREELLSLHMRDVDVDADKVLTAHRQLFEGGRLVNYEHQLRRKDGSIVTVLNNSRPLMDARGNVTGFLSTLVDVTERKQAERALVKTMDRYQQMLSRQYYGVLVVSEEERVEYANARFCELMGLEGDPLQLVGRGADEVVSHLLRLYADPLAVRARVEELVRGRRPLYGEEIHMKDGRIFFVDFVPLEVNGVPSGRMWIHRDVTQERALQDQLLQSQKLDTVGQLAGGIAHDFNNLLMVFGGCASLLLKKLPGDSSLRALVEDIRQAVGRGTGMTQQLLSLSRQQVGQPRPLDLNQLLQEVRKMAKHLIREHVEIAVQPAAQALWVVADHNQMLQILMNLIVNARDAMPSGGRLRIEAASRLLCRPEAGFPDAPPDRYAVITVSDTGCGMTPQVRARIFEPFFTTKPRGKGTGLGLSIVYNIVRQAKGYIRVESEVGKGSTFTLLLPLCPQPAHPVSPDVKAGASLRGTETVLLAEDDPEVRQVVRRILANHGYHVVVARDGIEALRLFEARRGGFPIVVSDVVMPRLNGLELIRKIRRLAPSTRLILMSGYSDADVMHQVLTERGVTFLPKPVDADLLLRRIRESLGAPPVAARKRPHPTGGEGEGRKPPVKRPGGQSSRATSVRRTGSSPGGTGRQKRSPARSSRRTSRRSR